MLGRMKPWHDDRSLVMALGTHVTDKNFTKLAGMQPTAHALLSASSSDIPQCETIGLHALIKAIQRHVFNMFGDNLAKFGKIALTH